MTILFVWFENNYWFDVNWRQEEGLTMWNCQWKECTKCLKIDIKTWSREEPMIEIWDKKYRIEMLAIHVPKLPDIDNEFFFGIKMLL